MLQPLVDRRYIPHHIVPVVLALSTLPACAFGAAVLLEHVSVHGAVASFLLWYARANCAATNFAIALVFTQIFELASLLTHRYNLVN